MDSFASLPTTTTNTTYYSNPSDTAPSQQLFDLQFASEVSSTNNEQFHQMLQHHQALILQQQQSHPQQVMYDHRRDSTSSSGGTNRRVQSKAEKRAEHNAIERARREGLNTRFQQLAHLLPNLQHDTRPSKGTIIERTLEFVKDAIQKEDRYRHEIKDLRHTNRQLLKQLTHLTTGQDANSEAMDDSDDQVSLRSPSPSVYALPSSPPTLPTQSLPLTQGSSTSSLSSGESSPPPTSTTQPPSTQQVQPHVQLEQHINNQQFHTSNAMVTPRKPHQQQPRQQQVHRRQRQSTAPETMANPTASSQLTPPAPSVKHTPSLSSFSSEVWHQPTSNTFWSQQNTSISHPPISLSYGSTHATNSPSIPTFANTGLFPIAAATPSSEHSPTRQIQQQHHYNQPLYIHASSEGDVDMKACQFNGVVVKEDQAYNHQERPNLFLSQHQHSVVPVGYNTTQIPPHRLTNRPAANTTAPLQPQLLPQFR